MRWLWKKITLTEKQKNELLLIVFDKIQRSEYIKRAEIILACSEIKSNAEIGKNLNVHVNTVNKWRERWRANKQQLTIIDAEETGINYRNKLLRILSDEPRIGASPKFTSEQLYKIMSIYYLSPKNFGLPLSKWSLNSLRDEIIQQGIVDNISRSRLAVFLNKSKKTHK